MGGVPAAYGSVEPHMSGRLHTNMLIHVIGFTRQQDLIAGCQSDWDNLQHRLREWVASI